MSDWEGIYVAACAALDAKEAVRCHSKNGPLKKLVDERWHINECNNCKDGAGSCGLLDDEHNCVGVGYSSKAPDNPDYGARLAKKLKVAVLAKRAERMQSECESPGDSTFFASLSASKPKPEHVSAAVKQQSSTEEEAYMYQNCPFADKDQVTALGTRWGEGRRRCRWFVPAGVPISPFVKWARPVQSGTKSDACREFCGGSCFMGDEGFLCPYRHPSHPFGEYCYSTPWQHPLKDDVLSNRCYADMPWFKQP